MRVLCLEKYIFALFTIKCYTLGDWGGGGCRISFETVFIHILLVNSTYNYKEMTSNAFN